MLAILEEEGRAVSLCSPALDLSRIRTSEGFTGQHRDHPDYTGPSVDVADRPCRIAMACWRVMMLQVMRNRLAVMASAASGCAGMFDPA
jgi:hypothetical protein